VKTLKDILKRENIIRLSTDQKENVFEELLSKMCQSPAISDPQEFEQRIFDREKLMSTGIGLGIGIPHAKMDSVKDLEIVIGLSKAGIKNYDSLDDQPVKIVFMIAAPSGQHTNYVKLLAEISRIMKNSVLREKIFSSQNSDEIYEILIKGEENGTY